VRRYLAAPQLVSAGFWVLLGSPGGSGAWWRAALCARSDGRNREDQRAARRWESTVPAGRPHARPCMQRRAARVPCVPAPWRRRFALRLAPCPLRTEQRAQTHGTRAGGSAAPTTATGRPEQGQASMGECASDAEKVPAHSLLPASRSWSGRFSRPPRLCCRHRPAVRPLDVRHAERLRAVDRGRARRGRPRARQGAQEDGRG
jgi:hypothetical protein